MTESPQQMEALLRDLSSLMNRHGIDAALDIPDFFLAQHIYRHLTNLKEGKEELERYKRLTHDSRTQGRTTQEEVALGGVGQEDEGRTHRGDGGSVQ